MNTQLYLGRLINERKSLSFIGAIQRHSSLCFFFTSSDSAPAMRSPLIRFLVFLSCIVHCLALTYPVFFRVFLSLAFGSARSGPLPIDAQWNANKSADMAADIALGIARKSMCTCTLNPRLLTCRRALLSLLLCSSHCCAAQQLPVSFFLERSFIAV